MMHCHLAGESSAGRNFATSSSILNPAENSDEEERESPDAPR